MKRILGSNVCFTPGFINCRHVVELSLEQRGVLLCTRVHSYSIKSRSPVTSNDQTQSLLAHKDEIKVEPRNKGILRVPQRYMCSGSRSLSLFILVTSRSATPRTPRAKLHPHLLTPHTNNIYIQTLQPKKHLCCKCIHIEHKWMTHWHRTCSCYNQVWQGIYNYDCSGFFFTLPLLSPQALKALQEMSLTSPCSLPPLSTRHSKAIPVQAFEVQTHACSHTHAHTCAHLMINVVGCWSSALILAVHTDSINKPSQKNPHNVDWNLMNLKYLCLSWKEVTTNVLAVSSIELPSPQANQSLN